MKVRLEAADKHVPWEDSKISQFSSHFPKCHISAVQARAFGYPPSTLQNVLVLMTRHHHRLINYYDSFQPSWNFISAKHISLHETCLSSERLNTLVKDYTGPSLRVIVTLTRFYAPTLVSVLPGTLPGRKKLTLSLSKGDGCPNEARCFMLLLFDRDPQGTLKQVLQWHNLKAKRLANNHWHWQFFSVSMIS